MGSERAADQLLEGLNRQQQEAVCQGWGPSLVVAGAGSGKTTVLTRRVAYLIAHFDQPPWSILAVTFTNKAAGEMRQRLERLLGPDTARRLWIGTFHSICARLMRSEIEHYTSPEGWRWQSNFVIYDETDSLNLVKAAIDRLQLDEKAFPPSRIRHKISSLKNDGFTHATYARSATSYADSRLAEIFSMYQADLARNNAFDFDDLILVFGDLLKQNQNILARQQDRFRHVLVDEFQDTNQAQYDLVRLLAGAVRPAGQPPVAGWWDRRSLMVVGDVDQSIYSWRRADYRIILGFQNDFKESTLIKLEENYRSTKTILEVANSIIVNNSERIEKVLRCNRGQGGKAACFEALDENDEAYYVAQELTKLSARGTRLSDVAVLYRTNAQSRALEEALVRRHLPYTMVGAVRFYERQEIKDVLAYLKLIYNGADGQSFVRIINTPRRGIGKTTIDKLAEHAAQYHLSLLEAAQAPDTVPGLTGKGGKGLKEFAAMIRRWQKVAEVLSVSALIELVLAETGYLDKLKEDAISKTDPTADSRIDNIKELIAVAREFEAQADQPDLEGFLTRVSLVSDLDSADFSQEAVKLMTLHSAKGLEFSVVFLTGLEEKLFPHYRSLDDPSALEEERRLMYVGVTRAADHLYLTWARRRMLFGGPGNIGYTIPSRFLKEIRSDLLQGYYPSPETPVPPSFDRPGSTTARSAWQAAGAGKGGQAPGSPGAAPRRAMRLAAEDYPGQLAVSPARRQEPVNFEHLSVGDVVQHGKFGVGKVLQVIGEKDKELYNIEFETAGKRLLDPRFAKLVKLN
ncbi:MAG TPA: UvrD-helicase domain-containing protein [Candidatus Obscuribacterales bacterium]